MQGFWVTGATANRHCNDWSGSMAGWPSLNSAVCAGFVSARWLPAGAPAGGCGRHPGPVARGGELTARGRAHPQCRPSAKFGWLTSRGLAGQPGQRGEPPAVAPRWDDGRVAIWAPLVGGTGRRNLTSAGGGRARGPPGRISAASGSRLFAHYRDRLRSCCRWPSAWWPRCSGGGWGGPGGPGAAWST